MVLAVTRDDSIVHFQALSAEQIDEEAVREIKCLMFQLSTEDVIESPTGLVLWVDGVDHAVVELAEEKLGIRVVLDHRPSPVLPEKGSKLLPTVVAIHRQQVKRRRKIQKVALALAAVWAVFIGWNVWNYYQAKQEADKLVRDMNRLRPKAMWIPTFNKRYDLLKKAIEYNRFPIELFHLCVSKLPPKDVRFTNFAIENETIRIQGEAVNSAAANRYGGILFGLEELKPYSLDWETRPKYNTKRKDGTVEFSIVSVYKTTKS